MNPPAWLAELHRQWSAARGRNLRASTRAFSRPWEDLLDDAGLVTAAERNQAAAEARQFQEAGFLRLRTNRYRTYLIEKVEIPPASENRLVEACGGLPAETLRREAAAAVQDAAAEGHTRWPDSWRAFCGGLAEAFAAGRNEPPFFWHDPAGVRQWLGILHGLTDRTWSPGTLIRNASEELAGDSKFLEKKQTLLESALTRMFGTETPLDALGLAVPHSRAVVQGRMTLHFPDGSRQDFCHLRGEYTVSSDDLARCEAVTTEAARILSIENLRTTFAQAAAVNDGGTLVLATSYPNGATRRLLDLLPAGLPHVHFGDTDPAGYAILRALRALGVRPVRKFLMDWEDQADSPGLTEFDRRLLPVLQQSELLADCASSLAAMASAGRKGRFEQERHGQPTRRQWPFWAAGSAPD